MKIQIINGPNLNLLGLREKDIYGETSFEDYFKSLINKFPKLELHYFQSNIEGEIIDKIHEIGFDFSGIVLNAAAYTHTSVGIADAVRSVKATTIEVHISNPFTREEFRHNSYLSKGVNGVICGFGANSYLLAIDAMHKIV